jgi:hypothetical protein
MRVRCSGRLLFAVLAGACGPSESSGQAGDAGGEIIVPDEPVPGVEAGCGSVRLTAYEATDSGWCEFSDTHAILPEFVRQRLTLAIAEPYNGSSYQGEPGEACGECWEIDTISATEVVMVNNLCPIEGNPLCAGGHFHFDLSQEAAAALGGGGLDAAQTRRVPCPVTGNIHAQLNDRNEWGYVRLAFVNHRFPIRTVEYRAADSEDWIPVQRSGGAWHVVDDNTTFADSGPGGVFCFTSPAGESVEGSAVLTPEIGVNELFDTGAQFAESDPEGSSCEFVPPGNVYDEQWGGIDQVRWQCNPWGAADCSETSEGCAEGSASCVLLRNLEQWNGFHLYYRQSFPTSTFSRLSLQLRARSGSGEVVVTPSLDGERCEETSVSVTDSWTGVEIDVAASCEQLAELNALTVSNQTETLELLVDEIRYE